jgi:membrane associated rhomboid family serine protease
MFGDFVEKFFEIIFGSLGSVFYILLYISSLIVCIIPTYMTHHKQYRYRSLGASGAVSAIVFVGIFLQPTLQIGFFIIPPIIPGFVFGPLYLALTVYLSKNGPGSINHSAHLWGALYGILFLIVASKLAGIEGQSDVINSFIEQIKLYLNKF